MPSVGEGWGGRLYGRDSGLHWIERTEETRALRCVACNTYDEHFIVDHRPSAAQSHELILSLRSQPIISTIDVFDAFDADVHAIFLDSGVPATFMFEFADGGFSFDLSAVPTVPVLTADYSRSRRCDVCGRTARVWQTPPQSDDVIVLAAKPVTPVCRSQEWFDLAYNRRPDVYVNASLLRTLGLDAGADFAVEIAQASTAGSR